MLLFLMPLCCIESPLSEKEPVILDGIISGDETESLCWKLDMKWWSLSLSSNYLHPQIPWTFWK